MRARRAIASLAAALLLASWSPARASPRPNPYEIYAVLPTTGGAAFLGKAEAAALQVFSDDFNRTGGIKGPAVARHRARRSNEPARSRCQLTNQALEKHPAIVMDGGPAATCRATAALIANGPLQYCLTPSIHPAAGQLSVFGAVLVRRHPRRVDELSARARLQAASACSTEPTRPGKTRTRSCKRSSSSPNSRMPACRSSPTSISVSPTSASTPSSRASKPPARKRSSRLRPARRPEPSCTACRTSGSTFRSSARRETCPTRRWNRTSRSCPRSCSSPVRRHSCPIS